MSTSNPTSTTPKITYTLFRRGKHTDSSPKGATIYFGNWGFSADSEGEQWRNAANATGGSDVKITQPEDETLEFVGHAKNASDIAAMVRRDPLQKYVVFHGEMMEVSVAIPVFVNGKNLETFSREWDVSAGDDAAAGTTGGSST